MHNIEEDLAKIVKDAEKLPARSQVFDERRRLDKELEWAKEEHNRISNNLVKQLAVLALLPVGPLDQAKQRLLDARAALLKHIDDHPEVYDRDDRDRFVDTANGTTP